MSKSLEEMSLKELLQAEEDAMLDMREATQFNDDNASRNSASYLDRIIAAIESHGVCRGGLNDGCDICTYFNPTKGEAAA